MNPSVTEFIKSKRIAIVGVSRNNAKFGNTLYKEMKARGFEVIPVHPDLETFEGVTCYNNLDNIQPKPDAIIINVSKQHTKSIIENANKADIKHVWLQLGSETPESIDLAKSFNMNVISGKCILMYAEPVKGVHAFHRFVWKLLKQY